MSDNGFDIDCIEVKTRTVDAGEVHEVNRRIIPETFRHRNLARSAWTKVFVVPDDVFQVLQYAIESEGPADLIRTVEAGF